MRDSDRTRPAGRAMARRLFEQVRYRYFLLSPGARRAIHVGVLAGALVLALALGWSLPSTLVVTVLLLGYGALAMRFPRGAATALVVAAWTVLVLVMVWPLGEPSALAGLLLLGPLTGAVAHLINWVPPWATTLIARSPRRRAHRGRRRRAARRHRGAVGRLRRGRPRPGVPLPQGP